MIHLASVLIAGAASVGGGGEHLTVPEARGAVREGYYLWAQSLDGPLTVGPCDRRGRARVICRARVDGRRQLVRMRIEVCEAADDYTLRTLRVK